jgi:hypothetical protein
MMMVLVTMPTMRAPPGDGRPGDETWWDCCREVKATMVVRQECRAASKSTDHTVTGLTLPNTASRGVVVVCLLSLLAKGAASVVAGGSAMTGGVGHRRVSKYAT